MYIKLKKRIYRRTSWQELKFWSAIFMYRCTYVYYSPAVGCRRENWPGSWWYK